MTWAGFYLFCFAFGFFFSVVAAVTGHLHLDFGGHGSMDAGHVHHVGGHGGAAHRIAPSGGHPVSPFNPGTMAAFLAWFGGTGFLITKFYRLWVFSTLGIALASGVAGGCIVYLFLSKVLLRSREEMDPSDYDMVGVLGSVAATLRSGGTGEILFSRDGARRAAAARSETGEVIQPGTEVVVTRYENGIAYVRRWDDLTSGIADVEQG